MTYCSVSIRIGILRGTLCSLSGREITISILCCLSCILTILCLSRCCCLSIRSRSSFYVILSNFLSGSICYYRGGCTSASLSGCGSRRPSYSRILSVWHYIAVHLASKAWIIMSIGGCIAILCAHPYIERILSYDLINLFVILSNA
jgi:hypothetical protein